MSGEKISELRAALDEGEKSPVAEGYSLEKVLSRVLVVAPTSGMTSVLDAIQTRMRLCEATISRRREEERRLLGDLARAREVIAEETAAVEAAKLAMSVLQAMAGR